MTCRLVMSSVPSCSGRQLSPNIHVIGTWREFREVVNKNKYITLTAQSFHRNLLVCFFNSLHEDDNDVWPPVLLWIMCEWRRQMNTLVTTSNCYYGTRGRKRGCTSLYTITINTTSSPSYPDFYQRLVAWLEWLSAQAQAASVFTSKSRRRYITY